MTILDVIHIILMAKLLSVVVSVASSMVNAWQWITLYCFVSKQLLVHSIDATYMFECGFNWSLIFWLMNVIDSLSGSMA